MPTITLTEFREALLKIQTTEPPIRSYVWQGPPLPLVTDRSTESYLGIDASQLKIRIRWYMYDPLMGRNFPIHGEVLGLWSNLPELEDKTRIASDAVRPFIFGRDSDGFFFDTSFQAEEALRAANRALEVSLQIAKQQAKELGLLLDEAFGADTPLDEKRESLLTLLSKRPEKAQPKTRWDYLGEDLDEET
jgi:hypothetical protein